MQSFIITLLICSVTMSVLALFYMAVTPLPAKRYSVTGRYYAWLIVVIGLIIPFRPQFTGPVVSADLPGNAAMPVLRLGNAAMEMLKEIIAVLLQIRGKEVAYEPYFAGGRRAGRCLLHTPVHGSICFGTRPCGICKGRRGAFLCGKKPG